MFNEFGHSTKIYCDLTKGMTTYKLSEEDIHKIDERLNNKVLPNQKKLDREYKGYTGYWRVNRKNKMNSYRSSKQRDKNGKLTKQQFMALYYRDINRKLNNKKKQIGGGEVAL
jgi:hypothetical protein